MKIDPVPSRGAAVEVVVKEPARRSHLLLGASLLGVGVMLGSSLRGEREPVAPVIAAAPGPALGAIPSLAIPPAPLPAPQGVEPAPVTAPAIAPASTRPRLEVMFAIDTTGSMGGILRAARAKVWTIADALLSISPTPELELGLVAYRDAGDEYEVRFHRPTRDLDAFYARLAALEARGGGDEPESVAAALHAALFDGWDGLAERSDVRSAKALILIGDAPPHSRDTDRTFELVRQARARGIAVHTIYCGEDDRTEKLFAGLALQGGGLGLTIDLHPTVERLVAPQDDAIAQLQRQLEATVLPWGTAEQQERLVRSQQVNASLPPEAWTARASANCKNRAGYADDLLQAIEEGRAPAPTDPRLVTRLELRKALRVQLTREVMARDAWLKQTRAYGRDPLTKNIVRAVLRQLEAQGFEAVFSPLDYGC